MGRAQAVPGVVVDQPGEQAWRLGVGGGVSPRRVTVEPVPDGIEDLALDDGLVLTRMYGTLVGDITGIDGIDE